MPILKSAALFCLKCLTLAIIFWFVWIIAFRPYSAAQQNNSHSVQNPQSKSQADSYESQVIRVNQQLEIAESQQKRMEKILAAQEENSRRFSAVLSAWEKQTSIKR